MQKGWNRIGYTSPISLPIAQAMVASVSAEGHGLAIALADDGEYDFESAFSAALGKTPAVTGGSWKLPLRSDWTTMAAGCGGYTTINAKLGSVGGTALVDNYWAPESRDVPYTINFGDSELENPFTPAQSFQTSKIRASLVF